jgi:hypothetical protein
VGWFSKREPGGITNPVRGRLQVVACSPFPDAGGEVILYPRCEIDGVITAERLVLSAVHYRGYEVPKAKWPRPGMVLPVTVDIADPSQFRIEWDQVPTGLEAAENLAARLRGERQADTSGDHAFPHAWRETTHAASSPERINGLTPQQTELALSGAAAALGLVPTTATVLSAQEVPPSSAPGGTWDITVRVSDPNRGQRWDAVTRMSLPSAAKSAPPPASNYPSWSIRITAGGSSSTSRASADAPGVNDEGTVTNR